MNRTSIVLALIAMFLMAGCGGSTATMDDSAAAAAPAAEAGKDTGAAEMAAAADEEYLDPNEEICKRIRKTGTRQTSKVCATRRQWELSEQQAQDATRKMQQRPQQGKEY